MNRPLCLAAAASAGGVALLWALAWYFSPHIYASSVLTAATTADLGTLVKRIDAERIRNAASEDLGEAAVAALKLPESRGLTAAVRAAIGQAMKVLTQSDDPALTEKLANLIKGKGFVTNAAFTMMPRELLGKRTSQRTGAYGDTFDVYYERVNFRETGEEMALTFERRGTLTWRMVGVRTNGASVLLPPLVKVHQ